MNRKQRVLWDTEHSISAPDNKEEGNDGNNNSSKQQHLRSREDIQASFLQERSNTDALYQYTITVKPRSLWSIVVSDSFVVGEEISFSVLLFSLHRYLLVLDSEGSAGSAGYGVISSLWTKSTWRRLSSHYHVTFTVVSVGCLVLTILILIIYKRNLARKRRQRSVNRSSTTITTINSAFKQKEGQQLEHSHDNIFPTKKQLLTIRKRDKVLIRFTDAVILIGLLRLLSSVLRTLTASYSSDTVMALAIYGMIIHVLACDYKYANGYSDYNHNGSSSSSSNCSNNTQGMNPSQKTHEHLQRQQQEQEQKQGEQQIYYSQSLRPVFQGGTISLNSSFFSSTLLASRLQSNMTAFVLILVTVLVFAFYPNVRHCIAAARRRNIRRSISGTVRRKGWHPLIRINTGASSLLPRYAENESCIGNDVQKCYLNFAWFAMFLHQHIAINIVYANSVVSLVLFYSGYRSLSTHDAKLVFCIILIMTCALYPLFAWYLQRYRRLISGPWDIAHVPKDRIDRQSNLDDE